ncbi:hypothetical protein SUGI_0521310 [Cryptomeria japonica]|nr:hypothetical protein SUGI_0521310 [Cryptomeria japonica]
MRREEWLEPHPISLVGGFYPSNLVPYVFPVRKDEYNSLTELICRGEFTQAGVVSEPTIQMLPEEEGQLEERWIEPFYPEVTEQAGLGAFPRFGKIERMLLGWSAYPISKPRMIRSFNVPLAFLLWLASRRLASATGPEDQPYLFLTGVTGLIPQFVLRPDPQYPRWKGITYK